MAGDIVSNKSFKFNNNMYLDSTGIVHSREKLDEIISNLQSEIDTLEKAQSFQSDETYEIISNLKSIVVASNAGAHNGIYRGEDITDKFYDGTLSEQIAAGTFDDIFIGDYIIGKSSGNVYLVANLDYYLHCGDTACEKHHLTLVPLAVLGSEQMNASNITTGAYISSVMYTTTLEAYREIIKADFEIDGTSHILTHRNYFQNAVTNGYPSGGTWYDSDIDLMNESMVYGAVVFGYSTFYDSSTIIPNLYKIEKSQLALFRHRPDLIVAKKKGITDINSTTKSHYWLRDVVSSSYFASAPYYGGTYYYYASYSLGVRPAFSII